MTVRTAERPRAPEVASYEMYPSQAPARERYVGLPGRRGVVKVSLVESRLLIRSALKMLIESQPGMSVVGVAGDCLAAGDPACGERPDVFLVNVESGEECQLACVAGLLKAHEGARVLVASDVRGSEFAAECMRAGASGLVTKDADPELLFKAIEKIHAGELWYERAAIGAALSSMARGERRPRDPDEAMIASLTARELEVIKLVGQGLKNRQIADRLFVCETTVRHHLTSIFSKLDLTDRLALLIFAYRHGLASLPGPLPADR